ncbi:hypothetical protein KY290_032477 [Solanum tuberosum]|uniref:Uncharacterized protein n=2 Tax=Solanum tuberosum TaxID=4113 RepID=M1AYB3_SOLTU|nr:hypothetical protein KY284_031482 [Solanum tuberosum]KAH0654201.1 hypothetical protein KY289_031879 [Solanum tuberosum]KAH0656811.1 hypothetical protein KY285_031693 [Solanum tuberosum]KAH0744484.1 hypothetical protein KY290_032477 [Solanum tuberosum]
MVGSSPAARVQVRCPGKGNSSFMFSKDVAFMDGSFQVYYAIVISLVARAVFIGVKFEIVD